MATQEPFLPLVEDFIAQARENRLAKMNMSVDQFPYFWTRVEHVMGTLELSRCARVFCQTCGQEHLFSELFHLTRLGEKRTGKCGHLMIELLVTWNG
jgi:hypothetical protein